MPTFPAFNKMISTTWTGAKTAATAKISSRTFIVPCAMLLGVMSVQSPEVFRALVAISSVALVGTLLDRR